MIVVDTNIVAYYCLNVDLSAAAHRLAQHDPEWHAPELWRSEFRNVLAGEMRRRNLTLARAQDAMGDAERVLEGRCHRVASDPVLCLIAETPCTVYDLEFVVLARELEVPLFTMDRRLLAAFPNIAVPLTSP